jgi:hypothetical protein
VRLAFLPALSPRARRIARAASAVLSRLLLVVAALELVWVVAANVALKTSLLSSVFNSSPDLQISYRSASSPWPGRVRLEGLSVRMEDYNVQFLLTIERAYVDISLLELAKRTFHAPWVDAEGVSFKMRHKVHAVENARRLAAYPSIEGFSDPPLYRGPKPPPISDADYDLWRIQIENVTAEVKELWFLEYRYAGKGVASGSFLLQPARSFELSPSRLDLFGGRLTVAERPVAETVDGRIACQVERFDVQKTSGLAPFDNVSLDLKLALDGGDLAFLDVYLEPDTGLRANGPVRVDLAAVLKQGLVQPPTQLTILAPRARVSGERAAFAGDVRATVSAPDGSDQLTLDARSERIHGIAAKDGVPGPVLESVSFGTSFGPRRVSQPMRLTSSSIDVHRGRVPSLQWFERWLEPEPRSPKLRGSAEFSARLTREGDGGMVGAAALEARAVEVRLPSFAVRTDAAVDVTLARAEAGAKSPIRATLKSDFQRLSLLDSGERTEPFSASIRSQQLALGDSPPSLECRFELRGKHCDALLPLVVGFPPLRDLLRLGLGLGDLDAEFWVRAGARNELDLVRAQSGAVTARGRMSMSPKGANGRFLLSTNFANVGVRLDGGETTVEPLVTDEWLGPKVEPSRAASPAEKLSPRSGDRGRPASPRAAESRQPGRAPKRLSGRAP